MFELKLEQTTYGFFKNTFFTQINQESHNLRSKHILGSFCEF